MKEPNEKKGSFGTRLKAIFVAAVMSISNLIPGNGPLFLQQAKAEEIENNQDFESDDTEKNKKSIEIAGETLNIDEDTIVIIKIGNSFLYYGDSGAYVAEDLKLYGKKAIVIGATHSEYSLAELVEKEVAVYCWDNRGEETKFYGRVHQYDSTLDNLLLQLQNANINSDQIYFSVQNHYNEGEDVTTNQTIVDKVKKYLPDAKNIIYYRTTGRRSSDNILEFADKNGWASINMNLFARNFYKGDWQKELTRDDDSNHPTNRYQFIAALLELGIICGKDALATDIGLYNKEGEKLSKVIKPACQRKGSTIAADSVTQEEAHELQALVYEHFDECVKTGAVRNNYTEEFDKYSFNSNYNQNREITKLSAKNKKIKTLFEASRDLRSPIVAKTSYNTHIVMPNGTRRDVPAGTNIKIIGGMIFVYNNGEPYSGWVANNQQFLNDLENMRISISISGNEAKTQSKTQEKSIAKTRE